MGVGGIARDIADDAQLAVWRSEGCLVDEGWDLGRQVDAVDKHIRLDDLLVWAGLGLGLLDIPFLGHCQCLINRDPRLSTYNDVLKSSLDAKIHGTTTTTTERANNKHSW